VKKELTYIDLFSGAGGMSLGFSKAGFTNLFSVEFDKQIANTYKENFPSHNLYVGDIKELNTSQIMTSLDKNKEVDVVIGGPPCQGFSMAGNIGRTFIDDERNSLFKEFVRVVSIVTPKVFVMENVSRMATHNNGQTIKEIVNEFKKLKYKVSYNILQTADYGIPQKRQRIFIVGTKKNVEFVFPEKQKGFLSIKEAIEDLPKLKSGETSDIPNHNAMNHSVQMLHKMSYVPDGGNRNSIPENIRPKSGDARKYIRYDSKKPAVTITGDNRKIFHYSQNRALTSRELARIQTFPDDFIFYGNSGSIQQQIGNAVPPKLAELIAIQVKKAIKEVE